MDENKVTPESNNVDEFDEVLPVETIIEYGKTLLLWIEILKWERDRLKAFDICSLFESASSVPLIARKGNVLLNIKYNCLIMLLVNMLLEL